MEESSRSGSKRRKKEEEELFEVEASNEDSEAQQLNFGRSNQSKKQQKLSASAKQQTRVQPATKLRLGQKKGHNGKPITISSNLMQINDLDFDELLECAEENIENSAFFASSVQLMGIIDNTIGAIDERLSKKKSRIIGLSSTKNTHQNMLDHQRLLTPKVH